MGLSLNAAIIHCTNCHYEGRELTRGATTAVTMLGLAALGAGAVVYWPLLLVGIGVLAWAFCTPTCSVCPRCGWGHPIPKAQYEAQQELRKNCPCMLKTGGMCQVTGEREAA